MIETKRPCAEVQWNNTAKACQKARRSATASLTTLHGMLDCIDFVHTLTPFIIVSDDVLQRRPVSPDQTIVPYLSSIFSLLSYNQ